MSTVADLESITESSQGLDRRLWAAADELASLLRGLDVASLSGAEAAGVTEAFARIERLAMAGKTLAAGRVVETGYSREAG